MWLLYFVNGLNSSLTANLSAYITSDFSEHSLLTVITVITSVMGAACVMPIAKVLNLWDRTLGVCIMVLIAIMGLIMMAGCNNIATYCAAQVSLYPLYTCDRCFIATSTMLLRVCPIILTTRHY